EQNNAGGFTAQTWDIAGNEANFFVRDVTGGSRLPFRIRPGAPTSSIDISATGNVGVGTASPNALLQLNGSNNQLVFSKAASRGLEIGFDGTSSSILGFDRGASAYKRINYNAADHLFSVSG